MKGPWYTQYKLLIGQVEELRSQFKSRCESLGIKPDSVTDDMWKELAARAVFESNWQEGIYVNQGKTVELAMHAFDELAGISGPHVDMKSIVEAHQRRIVGLKRRGINSDEIAANNLSVAHLATTWVANEMANRQTASIAKALEELSESISQNPILRSEVEKSNTFTKGMESLKSLKSSTSSPLGPISGGSKTSGEVFRNLLDVPFESLLHPMKVQYIQFLHRIVLMGVADPRKCGNFRKNPVHVGDPDVMFAPASMVPKLMDEFCQNFPTILPPVVKYDPILVAATVSYKFVRIHPFHDGNGRVSRLLMNMVLWGHHPPVYLKADKKGRHKYASALKRANRGNLEPLACLIAMALIEIYQKLSSSLGPTPKSHLN